MKKCYRFLFTLLIGLYPTFAHAQIFQASLSGANEVPPNGSSATGIVFVGLNAATNEIIVSGSFGGLGSAYIGSHIHDAPAGLNGPIIQDLATDVTVAPDGLSGNYNALSQVFTLTDAAETALLAGELYINVHTTGIPGGEIRGQLLPPPALQLFQASLSSANEVPPVASTATGTVSVLLTSVTNAITVSGSFSGLTSAYTASHIHAAPAGVNGPIVQNLATDVTLDAGNLGGNYDALNTIFVLSDANEALLMTNGLYVNVHTTGFPGGEIRGQLVPTSLPVELVAFDAVADGNTVRLTWTTTSEENNAGFEVEHRISGTTAWNRLTFIEGRGTTSEVQRYSHRIEGLAAGTHRFRLKQIDYDGQFVYSPEVEVTIEVPGTHALLSAYPNPFHSETALQLTVARTQHVRVAVYDVLGRQVRVLHEGSMTGNQPHTLRLNGETLRSGVYLISVRGEFFSEGQQVMLLK